MPEDTPGSAISARSKPASSEHALDWQTDGLDWPNREHSCFITAGGLDWHVQRFGATGPKALLLHGTAASTHSWAKLASLLAEKYEVVAPDLPGHAFTRMSPDVAKRSKSVMSLPGMASSVAALTDAMNFKPDIVIGHSAGAAVLARMCLDHTIDPKLLVSLNGALLPFGSVGRYMLPAMARLLFQNSLVPWIFARQARDRGNVERLIRGTGSKLEPSDLDFYVRLFRSRAHVEAALAMMATWDLPALERELNELKTPLLLVAASEDLAVPPEKASDVARIVPVAQTVYLRGLGHLAHEEDPRRIADVIFEAAHQRGLA